MRSVSRIARILRCFSARNPRRALSEIAKCSKLDLGTTRRMLKALVGEGLVAYEASNKRYCLDLGLLELASAVVEGGDLRAHSQSIVDLIAQETGNTAFFGIHRNGEALCLARAEGSAVVLLRWWTLGGRMPMHCGAAPKTLLAYLPVEEAKPILSGKLSAFTARSETNPMMVRRELGRIRRQGYALAVDDIVLGVAGLAVPVFDRKRAIVGALSIVGLTPQIVPPASKGLLKTLQSYANRFGAKV
jgi:DNA-binding IclR family transcriptional regulator